MYKDPKRKVGSQSETPTLQDNSNNLLIGGYQRFTISKVNQNVSVLKNENKWNIFEKNLRYLKNEHKELNSFCDIGCSTGLAGFIARNNGFDTVSSLDHDPQCIEIMSNIVKKLDINDLKPETFSFGTKLDKTYDCVFCGAIIHWIWSLTSNFKSFDKIADYILSFSGKFLMLEWVNENDNCIKGFGHIRRNQDQNDEEYNTENFEKSFMKKFKLVNRTPFSNTRVLYTFEVLLSKT